MGVTIYYCLNTLFKTETYNGSFFCLFVRLFSFFLFYFILFFKEKNDQRSLTDLLFVCFWSMLSFIGETTVCVFWQLSTLSCSPTNFVPLLKTINKKKKKLKYICVR